MRASGSRCCRSNTPVRTPTSPRSPKDCLKTSSPGLSRFSYLKVLARGATLRYANQAVDARAIGQEIGARYVMEGTLRRLGLQLRVAVQLVDATSGAHLWAETYSRPFNPDDLFAVQDEVVPRIVSTVADAYGVLPHSMSQAVRSMASSASEPVRGAAPKPELCGTGHARGACRGQGGGWNGRSSSPGAFRLLGHVVDHAGR